jgi:hypothetical protein
MPFTLSIISLLLIFTPFSRCPFIKHTAQRVDSMHNYRSSSCERGWAVAKTVRVVKYAKRRDLFVVEGSQSRSRAKRSMCILDAVTAGRMVWQAICFHCVGKDRSDLSDVSSAAYEKATASASTVEMRCSATSHC